MLTLASLLLLAVGTCTQSRTTTRYWDCCKPSCAWSNEAPVNTTVRTWDANQNVHSDPNSGTVCDGGPSFACANNSPWAVDENMAYGFAETHISGGTESSWCCACYKLTFTSTSIAGKTMVVQSSNNGEDLGSDQFDLQIPGGGIGIFTSGCSAQYESWDGVSGGVSSIEECYNLPQAESCFFLIPNRQSAVINWFENADNPTMMYEEVSCPAELTAISGCTRSDSGSYGPTPSDGENSSSPGGGDDSTLPPTT
ncbi:RlpA-like double-psi beta-barrel-protein domain-containing protein-containing protein [Mucidula mucida]|nr:RlpA-like double-psi beta-barrel-protein domain-containing protein-containing protein [Mucidula mucida]